MESIKKEVEKEEEEEEEEDSYFTIYVKIKYMQIW